MRHALLDFDSKIPNLALMKISAYYKARGDEIELVKPKWKDGKPLFELGFFITPYDHIWLSCVFTWHRELALAVRHPTAEIHHGGTGFDWGIDRRFGKRLELPPEIENTPPDYQLYGDDRAVGFCQRGCNRKCGWCDVPKKEGTISENVYRPIGSWVPDWISKVLLLDNDVGLYSEKKHDAILYDCRQSGRKLSITQGYDIRTVTEERAKQLAEDKPWDLKFKERTLYIAWDYIGIEIAVRKGVELLLDAGFKGREITCFTIVGFEGEHYAPSWEDYLHRHDVLWKEYGVHPFVMVFNNRMDDPKLRAFARWTNRKVYKSKDCKEFADYSRNPDLRGAAEDTDPNLAVLDSSETLEAVLSQP